jgi:hypothetical protein
VIEDTSYDDKSRNHTHVASYYNSGETTAKGVLIFNIGNVNTEIGPVQSTSLIIPGVLLESSMSPEEIQAMFDKPAVTLRIQEKGIELQNPEYSGYNHTRPRSSQHGSELRPIPLGTFDDLCVLAAPAESGLTESGQPKKPKRIQQRIQQRRRGMRNNTQMKADVDPVRDVASAADPASAAVSNES